MKADGSTMENTTAHERAMSREHDLALEVNNLSAHFFLEEGVLRAVDGVDFTVQRGATLGLIGESGSGKTVTAQSILNIVPHPGRIVSGSILVHPRGAGWPITPIDITALDPEGKEIRRIRGQTVSMIFQEPLTSLSPVHSIVNQMMEAILLHRTRDKREALEIAVSLLEQVGLPNPHRRIREYPHQLSGGMRQRVMIASAISCRPLLLVADEPTTALDVTVQAQILELLRNLQKQIGMAILYITHDLGVLAGICSEVAVMYLGRIVEQGATREIFHHPLHPYTEGLMKSIPRIGESAGERLETIKGNVPIPIGQQSRCSFFDRCPSRIAGVCDKAIPAMTAMGENHRVRCFLHSDRAEGGVE